MSGGHVSRQDWMALFSAERRDANWMRLQDRVMAHVNECAGCRDLYEKGMALQAAARAAAGAAEQRCAGESAFRAVASADRPVRAADGPRGRLCVCVDSGAEEAAFIDDTLELEGCANKYALNPEEEGRRLLDDGGALCLELRDGQLLLALGDGEPRCECTLLAEDEEPRRAALEAGRRVGIELPPDSFCTLELVFF